MIGMMVTGSLLRGHVWWEVPNLLGSTFYGSRALRVGPGISTITGLALHFAIAGSVGALFGLACGGIRRRRLLLLLGLTVGLGWYFFAQTAFWWWVNPLVPLYASAPVFLLSHIVFGACLGFMGPGRNFEEAEAAPVSDGVE
jgi:hypothetical protein